MSDNHFSDNPYTKNQREQFQSVHRGRITSPGMMRDFCTDCGLMTEIPDTETPGEWQCEDCAPAYMPSGNVGKGRERPAVMGP